MKKIAYIALLLISFCAFPVWAVKVSSLYLAQFQVSSQSADTRAEAVKAGFIEVLTRVTGDSQVINNPDIKESLARPEYYVQEFSYSAPSTSSSQYQLNIRYEANDINRLLRRAGIAYWSDNRPLILVWLAVKNKDNTTEIIGTQTPANILKTMEQHSKRNGLPIIFPMMDVDDLNQVSPQDIASIALPSLKKAGQRYAPDGYLIGNIEPTETGYDSQWELVVGGYQWSWSIEDKVPEEITNTIIDQVTQTLSKHYLIKTADMRSVWLKLQVNNITQRRDLGKLMKYLKQINMVQTAQLSQVSGDVVELSVQLYGTPTEFEKHAAIGQHLVLKSQDDVKHKLIYEWIH